MLIENIFKNGELRIRTDSAEIVTPNGESVKILDINAALLDNLLLYIKSDKLIIFPEYKREE